MPVIKSAAGMPFNRVTETGEPCPVKFPVAITLKSNFWLGHTVLTVILLITFVPLYRMLLLVLTFGVGSEPGTAVVTFSLGAVPRND
jgi:hypothetical protein